jgi:hypothetical protein
MKLKYPTRIGKVLYPKGTIVTQLDFKDPLVVAKYPNIRSNADSYMVAVKFADRDDLSILHVDQVEN